MIIALLTACAASEAAVDYPAEQVGRNQNVPVLYYAATDTSIMSAPASRPVLAPRPTPAPDELEEYTGPLYHVFYHFLIAFPEIAKGNSYGINLDNDTVTPTEFWRSLEELYKNGLKSFDFKPFL